MTYLKINEIFFSIQGETSFVGIPMIFVRLSGCPLRCIYCDSKYAYDEGISFTVTDVLTKISLYSSTYVVVTGGEPLAQPCCHLLLKKLCQLGYTVLLETNGAYDVSCIDAQVIKILDIKTPGSLEHNKMLFTNLNYVNKKDEIKFVICDHNDYVWAKKIINEHQLIGECTILMSPCYDILPIKYLADWIVEDNLQVRLQIQLHKYIWGDVRGK